MRRRVFNSAPIVESWGAQGTPGEVLLDWDTKITLKSINYHSGATLLVRNTCRQKLMELGAVLDSGSGVTCISEKLAAQMGTQSKGGRLVFILGEF